MNPCFKKLHAFMSGHDACPPAFAAVESAADWDGHCAHPQAGEWAVWMAERLPVLAPLLAEYKAQEAALLADYESKRALPRAGFVAKRAPLRELLIAPVRKEFEPA